MIDLNFILVFNLYIENVLFLNIIRFYNFIFSYCQKFMVFYLRLKYQIMMLSQLTTETT